jgi:hypothetical protein
MQRTNQRIIADTLPEVGSILELEGFGKVMVILFSHDQFDNYITLEYLETILEGKPILTHRFSVLPTAGNFE